MQWGNITTRVNSGTVTLSISFSNTTYFVTADPTEDGNYTTNNVRITDRSTNAFTYHFYQGSAYRVWFAIGF